MPKGSDLMSTARPIVATGLMPPTHRARSAVRSQPASQLQIDKRSFCSARMPERRAAEPGSMREAATASICFVFSKSPTAILTIRVCRDSGPRRATSRPGVARLHKIPDPPARGRPVGQQKPRRIQPHFTGPAAALPARARMIKLSCSGSLSPNSKTSSPASRRRAPAHPLAPSAGPDHNQLLSLRS